MFYICGIVFIFCLQLKKDFKNTKKTRRLSKEEIKQQLIDSIINNYIMKTEESNEKVDKAEKPKYAAANIKQYRSIICTKKKNVLSTSIIKEKFLKGSKTRKSFKN